MNNLVEAVKKYQAEEEFNDSQLAQFLGIDKSTWSYIKSGKRKPGLKFLRAVVAKIPHLKSLISAEMFQNGHQRPPSPKLGRLASWARDYFTGK